MKFKILHFAYLVVGLIGLFTFTSLSGGKSGASSLGCGGTGCHSQSNATSILVSFDGNSNLTSYTPGKKYAITLTISNTSFSSNSNAKSGLSLNFSKGNISAVPANTKVTGQELNHDAAIAIASGSKTFNFDWTAPGAGQGSVNIDISANIVNGDNGTSNDAWAKVSKSLTEEVSSTPKKPSIASITTTSITTTGVTINAQINANNLNTSAEVQYGKTTSYGTIKAMTPASITGTSNTSSTSILTGLESNMTYNYRIKATNSAGDSLSPNFTFKTNSAGAAVLNTSNLSIHLYPNPSSDYVILSGNDLTSIENIAVVNMSGKSFSLPIIHAKSDQIRLNTGKLSKGKYFIQIQSGDKISSLPLLID